ncbi:MAG: deoxyribose-phosphate aldolase [Christensenellaceae bacterium]|jgi:deoxyribose-phosphate aldolase|nr:deoxyribose-phosphate aldolase [Christensenellaceae bacterium]
MKTSAIKKELIAGQTDFALLSPTATSNDVREYCKKVAAMGGYSVCVNPANLAAAKETLGSLNEAQPDGNKTLLCAVVGFPLGATTTMQKFTEAEECVSLGANEIDAVMNIGALKGGETGLVRDEIALLARFCKSEGVILKIIIETCYLTDAEKRTAVKLCAEGGADFVKTSTGFGTGGATLGDIKLMKSVIDEIGSSTEIKASGGIKTLSAAEALIDAGATRLGMSSLPEE